MTLIIHPPREMGKKGGSGVFDLKESTREGRTDWKNTGTGKGHRGRGAKS